MKTLTKIDYSKEEFSRTNQYTAYVRTENEKSWLSLVTYIENNTEIRSLTCPSVDRDGKFDDCFSSQCHFNKKEFLEELRITIKEWKLLNK